MPAIYTGLKAGFIVGVVCVLYVLYRSWRIQNRIHDDSSSVAYQDKSNHWMVMGVISSASLVWGFLGAGVFHLVKNAFWFFVLSVIFAIFMTIFLMLRDTRYKGDKIVLNLIIVIGLGILIPSIY